MKLEFTLDPLGEFDETFVENASVHIERMNETGFWIGIDLPDGQGIMVNTGVASGEWFFNVDEDAVDGRSFSVRRPRSSIRKLPLSLTRREIAAIKALMAIAEAGPEGEGDYQDFDYAAMASARRKLNAHTHH